MSSVGVDESERSHALAMLRRACVDGELTLDEFASRVGDVLAGGDCLEELDPAVGVRAAPTRWIVSVFGSARARASWPLGARTGVVAVFGNAWLDLSDATLDGDDPLITVVALFGTVKLIVPRGIEVDVSGVPVFGARKGGSVSDDGGVLPGSPVVHVRCYPIFGAVKVLEAS